MELKHWNIRDGLVYLNADEIKLKKIYKEAKQLLKEEHTLTLNLSKTKVVDIWYCKDDGELHCEHTTQERRYIVLSLITEMDLCNLIEEAIKYRGGKAIDTDIDFKLTPKEEPKKEPEIDFSKTEVLE